MIRLTLFLVATIWAAMEFAPEVGSPVFRTEVAKPVPEPAPLVETQIIPVAITTEIITITEPDLPMAPLVSVDSEKIEVVAEIKPEEEASLPVPEPARIIWFVKGSKVNVRQGPSTDHPVMGQVVYGEAAEVISDLSGDWIKIRIEGDGVEGFIAKRFMTAQDPLGD